MIISTLIWTLSAVGEHLTPQLGNKILWIKISYLGISVLPVTWLVFTLQFSDKNRWLTKRNIILLSVIPFITLVLVWTDDIFHLMWEGFQLSTTANTATVIISHNIWFWLCIAYFYLLISLGSLCLLGLVLKKRGIYRKQAIIMLLAVFAPWLTNVLYLTDFTFFSNNNVTPLSFVVTGTAFYWGMSRLYLLDIMPVAREAVFKSMKDGVIITDTQNLIIDINTSALLMLGLTKTDITGHNYNRAIPGQIGAIDLKPDIRESHVVMTIGEGTQLRHYGVHISAIMIDKHYSGHVIILHDDTQVTSLATTDGLTGLYNHRQFHKLLDQEIARSSRFANVFSLLMLDVDLFKSFNDTYGHLAGDNVLHEIGECINKSIRSIDFAFRYGGEEFAIILPGTTLEDAYIAAERIRNNIEHMRFLVNVSITASIGVACWPADGVEKEQVIAHADAALYMAKHMGRNRTCLSAELGESVTISEIKQRTQNLGAVYALAAAVEAKDIYTYGHSQKVAKYCITIAQQLGLSVEKVNTLRSAALLHDIGNIGIPDSILGKKGSFTKKEWEIIKTHPVRGIKIIKQIDNLNDCLPAILHHHERYDGTGYPSQLSGKDIPFEARILAIADAYDAITSPRSYHFLQRNKTAAIEELRQCSGTQFDPELVEVFCRVMEQSSHDVEEVKTNG